MSRKTRSNKAKEIDPRGEKNEEVNISMEEEYEEDAEKEKDFNARLSRLQTKELELERQLSELRAREEELAILSEKQNEISDSRSGSEEVVEESFTKKNETKEDLVERIETEKTVKKYMLTAAGKFPQRHMLVDKMFEQGIIDILEALSTLSDKQLGLPIGLIKEARKFFDIAAPVEPSPIKSSAAIVKATAYLPKYKNKESIFTYLDNFEDTATQVELPKRSWARTLRINQDDEAFIQILKDCKSQLYDEVKEYLLNRLGKGQENRLIQDLVTLKQHARESLSDFSVRASKTVAAIRHLKINDVVRVVLGLALAKSQLTDQYFVHTNHEYCQEKSKDIGYCLSVIDQLANATSDWKSSAGTTVNRSDHRGEHRGGKDEFDSMSKPVSNFHNLKGQLKKNQCKICYQYGHWAKDCSKNTAAENKTTSNNNRIFNNNHSMSKPYNSNNAGNASGGFKSVLNTQPQAKEVQVKSEANINSNSMVLKRLGPEYTTQVSLQGRNFVAKIDTGANVSIVNRKVVEELKLVPRSARIELELAVDGVKRVINEEVLVNFEKPKRMSAYVLVANTGHDFLLGTDLLAALGIGGLNLVCIQAEPDDDNIQAISEKPDRLEDPAFALQAAADLAPQLENNANIPEDSTVSEVTIDFDWKDDTPVFHKPARVPFQYRTALDHTLDEMLRTKKIRFTEQETKNSIRLVIIAKKKEGIFNGELRLCLDVRALNQKISDSSFALPLIDDTLIKLAKGRIFSKIDLKSAFHQIKLPEAQQHTFAFCTEYKGMLRQFEFLVVPMGMKNIPKAFQRIITEQLKDMPNTLVFIDDIIIFSDTYQNHIEIVRRVLEKLTEIQFRINPAKCFFGYQRLRILGHMISHDKIDMDPLKGDKLINWPYPSNADELHSFLGLFGYIKEVVPMSGPLHARVALAYKDATIFETPNFRQAIDDIKNSVNNAITKSVPEFNKPFEIKVDASDEGMGAALLQKDKIIAVASRPFHLFETRYSVFKKECRAILFALEKFYYFIEGSEFEVHTDHAPLLSLNFSKELPRSIRQWFSTFLEHKFVIKHVPGLQNGLADALSRLRKTKVATSCAALLRPTKNLSTEDKTKLVQEIHRTSHGGQAALLAELKFRYHLGDKLIRHLVKQTISDCQQCQKHAFTSRYYSPYDISVPNRPWYKLQLDLKELSVSSKGNKYCLVIVCCLTGFTVLRPLRDKQATTLLSTLRQVFGDQSFPHELQIDGGTEANNNIVRSFLEDNKVTVNIIPPHVHQTNGIVERKIRHLSAILVKRLGSDFSSWDDELPVIQLLLNAQISSVTNNSPFELQYARPIRLPALYEEEKFEEVQPSDSSRQQQIADRDTKLPVIQQMIHDSRQKSSNSFFKRHRRLKEKFVVGQRVMLEDENRTMKFEERFKGPYLITAVNNNLYSLQHQHNNEVKEKIVSQRLKLLVDHKMSANILSGEEGKIVGVAINEKIAGVKNQEMKITEENSEGEEYFLEKIVDHKDDKEGRWYKARWSGYQEDDDTWEKAAHFKKPAIDTYWKEKKGKGTKTPAKRNRTSDNVNRIRRSARTNK